MISGVFSAPDTIVAIASPPGRGAIALVRLSGPDAFAIAARHLRAIPVEPRVAHLCDVLDGDGKLDQALVTLFPAPNSFTGEDVVEFSTHGGYVVPTSIVAALTASGARQALPGEFTRRAVLNGKLDVIQRTAIDQLDGGLSRRLLALREDIVGLEALIAYDVDFPEEDDGPISRARIETAADTLLKSLEQLLATAPVGELIREGAIVVIAGPPNVGKSSLFNALLGRSRAIVTEIPGTTRDALEAVVDSGKWPLRLVDTAGLRETGDRIERLGIEVSERYLAAAHVVLVCAEQLETLHETANLVGRLTKAAIIPVRTKADLVAKGEELSAPVHGVAVSAETGSGLRELVEVIDAVISENQGLAMPDSPILTSARQRKALEAAQVEVGEFIQAWRAGNLPVTVAAVHLRTAVSELEELIGTLEVDDVLERLFSAFCVGK